MPGKREWSAAVPVVLPQSTPRRPWRFHRKRHTTVDGRIVGDPAVAIWTAREHRPVYRFNVLAPASKVAHENSPDRSPTKVFSPAADIRPAGGVRPMRPPIAAFSRPSRLRFSSGRQNPRGLSQSRPKTLKKLATRPQRCKVSPNEPDAKAILPNRREP